MRRCRGPTPTTPARPIEALGSHNAGDNGLWPNWEHGLRNIRRPLPPVQAEVETGRRGRHRGRSAVAERCASEGAKAPRAGATPSKASDGRSDQPVPSPVPGSGPPPAPAPPAAPRLGSPIVLASVGNYSGPLGAATVPIVTGAQVWVKHVNEGGGLNGHKIKFLIYDDGSDPARHKAQVPAAVEQQGVLAFFQNTDPVTGESAVDYITAKGVPVEPGLHRPARFHRRVPLGQKQGRRVPLDHGRSGHRRADQQRLHPPGIPPAIRPHGPERHLSWRGHDRAQPRANPNG